MAGPPARLFMFVGERKSSAKQDSRSKSLFRLGLLSLMLLVLFSLAWTGVSAEILDAEKLRHWVSGFGMLAPLIFASAFLLIVLVLLPPTLMTLTAGFLFGPSAGLLISVVCVNLGGICIFLVARYLGREGVYAVFLLDSGVYDFSSRSLFPTE